jgi:hypothetical protein
VIVPAGWYADPSGQVGLRWWDGVQWTGFTDGLPASVGAAEHRVADALQGVPENAVDLDESSRGLSLAAFRRPRWVSKHPL